MITNTRIDLNPLKLFGRGEGVGTMSKIKINKNAQNGVYPLIWSA